MRKNILIVISILLQQACTCNTENKPKQMEQVISDSSQKSLSREWMNPALIYGSDFLNVFKRYYINQDYKSMMCLTSKETIRKFGAKNILEFYQKGVKLGYSVKLKSLNYNSDSTSCVLNYESDIFASKQIKSIHCMVENDSVKISVENLQSIFVNE